MTKNTGKVKFDSTPINLDVILNKKYIGKTPIDVVDIIPGVYEYNIKVDSNKIFTDRLIVYSNKTTYINKDFNLEIINPNENCINNNTLNLSILEELKKTNEQFKETNAQLIKINNNLISYEIRYYDESGTITYTTLIKPESTDSPFYDVKNINNSLSGRNAKVLNITNDGQGSMFVVISHDGMNFTEESPIYESDVKQYFDVNKVLLRGDRAGCKFRITEYPHTNVTANIQKSERI